MAVKPEDLDEDTTFDDADIVLKTNSSHVTRTIKASNIFSWLWAKVKAKILSSEVTLHALDEAQSYTPVDSTAVNSAINGALTEQKPKLIYHYGHNANITDLNLGDGYFKIFGCNDSGAVEIELYEEGTSVFYTKIENGVTVLGVGYNAIYLNAGLTKLMVWRFI